MGTAPDDEGPVGNLAVRVSSSLTWKSIRDAALGAQQHHDRRCGEPLKNGLR
jgi:hypothetical protein